MGKTISIGHAYQAVGCKEVVHKEWFLFEGWREIKTTEKVFLTRTDGSPVLRLDVILPNGEAICYKNTTEKTTHQVELAVINVYQSQGYKAPQNEIAKFLRQMSGRLIMMK